MKILVTGGAGAIGSHLVEAFLNRGDEVAVLDCFHDFYPRAIKEKNLAAARQHAGFSSLHECDIREPASVRSVFETERPDAVVHLAARAGVRPSLDAPGEYADVNVTGTTVVLREAIEVAVPRFIFASSSSVYGEKPRGPFHEDLDADHPLSPYGASKRAGELLCHAMHHTSGISISCLRFFTAYGPRQRPDLAIHKFARLIQQGKPIPIYGDGSAERDFTFVSDLVDGIVRATDRAEGFKIYNLGRGEPVTLNETIAKLESALGLPVERNLQPPVNGDVPRTWASIDRARDELGYKPRVSLDEGISRFVRWLGEEGA